MYLSLSLFECRMSISREGIKVKAARMPIYQGCSGVLYHVIICLSVIVYIL